MPQFNIHTVLIALRCWWHIALPMGLLLGGLAAVTVFYVTVPTFTASTWIEIRERAIVLLANASPDDPRKFVANQIELMRSPPVLEPVAGLSAVRSAPELVDEEDPVMYLRNHLHVEAQGGSDYFVIEFTSADPVKAALIANEVANSYLALQEGHESKVGELTIELLQEQQRHQEGEVKRLRDRLQDLSKQLTGKEAFPLQGKNEQPERRNRTLDLQDQLLDAELEQLTLEAEIKAETDLFQQESFAPPSEAVTVQVDSDPKVLRLRAQIALDREKLAVHKARSVDLAKNPLYKPAEKILKDDEAALEAHSAQLRTALATEMENFARAKRQEGIAGLQAKLVRVGKAVEFLKQRSQGERTELQKAAGDTLQLEFAWADYHRSSEFLEAISNRIVSMQVERRAPERVKMFRTAAVPLRPDEEVPYKKMLMAALVALLLPFGAAVGIEMLFCRVSSRQQLEGLGKMIVVGEVTTLPKRIRGRKPAGSQPQRDVQLFEESINGLRTYLSLVHAAQDRKVLAVTSSVSREGKTSLAAQLAVSVASAAGKRTLLIDGDMRSPDLHQIFGIDCAPGLAEVLDGTCPLEEAIETQFSDRLHVLTAGHLAASPHQLMGEGKFESLIEKLRGMYDHIILDTPPILPASEALLMARAADAAILCVRRDFSRVDQVSEAYSRLVGSGAKMAGAVLNGVPTQHYAYRYGTYDYTRNRAVSPTATAGTTIEG